MVCEPTKKVSNSGTICGGGWKLPCGPTELEGVRSDIHSFVETTVAAADAEGVIVPMSGGIDSTLTATLAVEALGSERVIGMALPCTKTDEIHRQEARTIADGLGIEFHETHLRPVLDAFEDAVAAALEAGGRDSFDGGTGEIGNVIARLRMVCAYYAANARSLLVCGTANRSELLLGYFTKHGDGGADLYPLGDLYKTEVRALADHVGLPRRIIRKAPTAGLRAGQTDADDLGATYDVIDPLLYRLVDRDESVSDAASATNADTDVAERVASLVVESRHKRSMPPTPGVDTPNGDRSTYARGDTNSAHLREER